MAMAAGASGGGSFPAARWVAILCWSAIAVEGFDVVVLGTVIPALLEYEAWGLSAARMGLITSYALVGMLVGSLAIGTVTDVIGRRNTILICVTSFSLFTGLCAAAPSPEVFGLLRFLSGLGLGGVLPTAAALVSEYAGVRRGSSSITFMMTGYHVGAVLTALVAIPILPTFGWRAMFLIGALPALVLGPLMFRRLPESPAFPSASARRPRATKLAARHGVEIEPGEVQAEERAASGTGGLGALRTLFSGGYVFGTLAFFVASFMGLLLVYGLNAWLPQIMREAGYPIGAALAFLLALNVGAIIVLLVSGRVADRYGSKAANVAWFALAAVFLFLLSIQMPLALTYLAVVATGFWVFSAQVLLYAYVSKHYPTSGRATALGWVAGIGRIGSICGPLLGGFLVGAGLVVPWSFYAFALVGLLGAVFIALVPRSPAEAVKETSLPGAAAAR